jgi:hypothetical protein
MDIIFITLPKYLEPISILLQKFGHQVYYLKLSGYKNIDMENISAERLKQAGVLPLPIEDLASFKGFSELDSDPTMKVYERTQQIAPVEFLRFFEKLFPNNPNISKKLQIIVNLEITNLFLKGIGKVNIWADAHPNRNFLLVDVSFSALINQKPRPNVKLLIIPLDDFIYLINMIFSFFNQILHSRKTTAKAEKINERSKKIDSNDLNESRVVLVTHQGLNYGNLFQKDLFYSSRIDSELYPERLIHFDYSGVTSPSEKLTWIFVATHRHSMFSNFYSAFGAIKVGLPHIRHLRHIIGFFLFTRCYVVYRSFSKNLAAYPGLKIALIDYEILCPKELLLAFENRGIRTVAVQERIILSFYKLYGSTILSHYLCGSPYSAENMKNSPLYSVDHYLPVGQYRSDNLMEAIKSPPPKILEAPIAKGLKVITVLGFHTQLEWHNSQLDLFLNWKSHQQFLDDIIRLSLEIPDVFIILRYKNVDWVSLPIFAETIQKINASDKVTISMDYDKFLVSYDLCAHSDLVIAKHTSLADECLSVGIPVLFHEYTHNTERLVADAFDYSPSKIMCFNYQELKERALIILSGTPNAMTEDYDYLKNVVYGGLGDGRVKERIHAHIEKMIAEL